MADSRGQMAEKKLKIKNQKLKTKMIWRIEVGFKAPEFDALGAAIRRQIQDDLRLTLDSVSTIDVYLIGASLNQEEIKLIAADLLTDPIVQKYGIWNLGFGISSDHSLVRDFSQLIEVGYKPGVTDNVAQTTQEAIEDMLGIKFKEGESVHTAKMYLLKGGVSPQDAEKICLGLLANPLVQDFSIWDEKSWQKQRETSQRAYWMISSKHRPEVKEINLDVSDKELLAISEKGLLSLNLNEMRAIREYFYRPEIRNARKKVNLGPNPTDVELEMLAQTWSEHCKHKIFNSLIEYRENGETRIIDSLFKSYIRGATEEIAREKDWLVSVFVDNAGIIRLNEEWNLVFKVETHNHPSALDPYGGALTGIVGVNRDPMGTGLGARLIFNTDVFCFGPPDFPEEKLPPGVLHPKRIFKGVRKGVEDGGNKIGIPTVNGAVLFDEAYVYNPLVYCGTGGIMPRKIRDRDSHLKEVKPGDLIVMVGGRIGKDGIHGATFSSTKLEETTPSAVVQIGAPIVQKKMMDTLLEARDQGLYRAITDNGAGGLSSSVGEMAQLSGGCRVDLEKAPLKYRGLDPWELWVSESQERMTLAVPPEKINAFLELCRSRDVEATALGVFTDSGKVEVRYGGKTVAHLDLEFLHQGLPRLRLKASWEKPRYSEPKPSSKDLTASLESILGSLNVCSKEWVIRQYDHEVQGGSVIRPLVGIANDGPSDAAVLKPLPDATEGVVVANGINPKYGLIDSYWMAASAIDEAIRNVVAVGGNPEKIALLDNFCWGNPILSPENPQGDFKLGQLVRAAQACCDTATGFGTPFISGKDSLHNEYKVGKETISIPPTLLISSIGVIDACEKAVSMDAKSPGDLVYVLGMTDDELGGSHYFQLQGYVGNNVPKVYPKEAKKLYLALHRAIVSGLVASCHDCSEGGLAVAAAETAFAGGLGMNLDLRKVPARGDFSDDILLFSESNSRFVVTVSQEKREEFETCLAGVVYGQIGQVTAEKAFVVRGIGGQKVVEASIERLKEVWQEPLRW